MSGILSNPLYRPLLEIVRSARNGVVYGGKIRFSHALVINLLYRSGPMRPRMIEVLKATKNHAEVLASFAIVYKLALNVLLNDQVLGPNSKGLCKFVAGCFGSWIVYSQHFSYFHPGITHQITLYCFSRVLIAVCKILLDNYLDCTNSNFRVSGTNVKYSHLTSNQKNKLKQQYYNKSWKYFAVLTWGLVMFIYDYQPQYLQSSLRHSMHYIYDVELDTWGTWKQFFGI